MNKVDELIKEYAGQAEKIYEERTAGDYTWNGLLAHFLIAYEEIVKTEE